MGVVQRLLKPLTLKIILPSIDLVLGEVVSLKNHKQELAG